MWMGSVAGGANHVTFVNHIEYGPDSGKVYVTGSPDNPEQGGDIVERQIQEMPIGSTITMTISSTDGTLFHLQGLTATKNGVSATAPTPVAKGDVIVLTVNSDLANQAFNPDWGPGIFAVFDRGGFNRALIRVWGYPYIPASPTDVSVTVSGGDATFSWASVPRATGYRVQIVGGDDCDVLTTTCLIDIRSLPLGPHTATLVATVENPDGGYFAASSPSDVSFYILRRPVEPEGITAVAGPGSGQVTITVSPSDDDGGTPILEYLVTKEDRRERRVYLDACTISATAAPLSCVVSGLTNGVEYRFFAAARNSVGLGQESNASDWVMPVGVPGVPTDASATRSTTPGGALVTWVSPSDNGGLPILEYRVIAEPGGITCTTTEVNVIPLACTVSELTLGTTYTFKVEARNAAGWSEPSEASAALTMGDVPAGIALAAADVTPGDRSATLSFPTLSDEPFPVTTYRLEIGAALNIEDCAAGVSGVVGFNLAAAVAVRDAESGRTQVALTRELLNENGAELDNRTTYCVRIGASNEAGAGPMSAWRLLTPRVANLGAPTQIAVTGAGAVTWLSFVSASGPVASYDYSLNGAPWQPRNDDGAATSPLRLSGFDVGAFYTLRLRAVGADGQAGPPATLVTFLHADAASLPVPAPNLELVVPAVEPVVGFVDGNGILSFTATLANSGDGVLTQAWLRPQPQAGGEVINIVAESRGTITQQANGRWHWGGLDLAPGASTEFTVTVQIRAQGE
jgi:hypothetical protein